jgi:hypothetical protein
MASGCDALWPRLADTKLANKLLKLPAARRRYCRVQPLVAT